MVSAPWKRRGIRPASDSQSCCPRSSTRSAVIRVAMIRLAANAAAPKTRTAW